MSLPLWTWESPLPGVLCYHLPSNTVILNPACLVDWKVYFQGHTIDKLLTAVIISTYMKFIGLKQLYWIVALWSHSLTFNCFSHTRNRIITWVSSEEVCFLLEGCSRPAVPKWWRHIRFYESMGYSVRAWDREIASRHIQFISNVKSSKRLSCLTRFLPSRRES